MEPKTFMAQVRYERAILSTDSGHSAFLTMHFHTETSLEALDRLAKLLPGIDLEPTRTKILSAQTNPVPQRRTAGNRDSIIITDCDIYVHTHNHHVKNNPIPEGHFRRSEKFILEEMKGNVDKLNHARHAYRQSLNVARQHVLVSPGFNIEQQIESCIRMIPLLDTWYENLNSSYNQLLRKLDDLTIPECMWENFHQARNTMAKRVA